jgi:hypothetical protein
MQWFLKIVSPVKLGLKWAIFTQIWNINQAERNYLNFVFQENRRLGRKKSAKSEKIGIITLTPVLKLNF